MSSKTTKIYPKSDFVGILNKNNSFSKQSASQGIIIGKDTKDSNALGRGYLNFDLSSIPKDATIEKVSLQLTSKINFDGNFNGKIRIERSSANLTQYDWGLLDTVAKDEGYTGLNHTFSNEGSGYPISHQWLTDQVKSTLGKSLQLKIKHYNESSSIVRLDGSNSSLFLSITYTESSTSSGESGGNAGDFGRVRISGPDDLFIITGNEEAIYESNIGDVVLMGGALREYADWSISSNLQAVRYYGDRSGIVVKVKDKTSNKAVLTLTHNSKFEKDQQETLGKATKQIELFFLVMKPSSNLTDLNTNITYSLSGVPTSGATITWQAVSNASFVSGQNTANGIFKTTGNGFAKIKATITYKGHSYTIENSEVWVGAPKNLKIEPMGSFLDYPLYSPNLTYNFLPICEGNGITYNWTYSGSYLSPRISNGALSLTIPSNGGSFTTSVTATNKYGSLTSSLRGAIYQQLDPDDRDPDEFRPVIKP